jgi:hypothetical protein
MFPCGIDGEHGSQFSYRLRAKPEGRSAEDRSLPTSLAAICPFDFDSLDNTHRWLASLTRAALVASGLDETTADRILQLRDAYTDHRVATEKGSFSFRLSVSKDSPASDLIVGDRVLVVSRPDVETCTLWTIEGKLLAEFTLSHSIKPEWWNAPHLVASSIGGVRKDRGGKVVLSIDTVEI